MIALARKCAHPHTHSDNDRPGAEFARAFLGKSPRAVALKGWETVFPTFIDMSGKTIGKLTVIRRATPKTKGHTVWLCRCSCGRDHIARTTDLRNGDTSDCGCVKREKSYTSRASLGVSHDERQSPEFACWRSMVLRCRSKNAKAYPDYGGRGISVCDDWLNSYFAFLRDMGRRPTEIHSLDRINNDGNYELSNCRWATPAEQTRNQRTNHIIEFEGVRKCMCDWARAIGISKAAMRYRLKHGWTREDALFRRGRVLATSSAAARQYARDHAGERRAAK